MKNNLNIIGGNPSEKRREMDFYPTPAECTIALLPYIPDVVKTIWEPACGDGHMSEVFKKNHFDVYSTDIRKTTYSDDEYDFISGSMPYTPDAIITNPPFNKSEEFIKEALDRTPVVAMLLKSQYWHAKTRLKLFTENTPSYVLPLTWRPNFFGTDARGSSMLDMQWTMCIDGDNLTKYIPLAKPLKSQISLF